MLTSKTEPAAALAINPTVYTLRDTSDQSYYTVPTFSRWDNHHGGTPAASRTDFAIVFTRREDAETLREHLGLTEQATINTERVRDLLTGTPALTGVYLWPVDTLICRADAPYTLEYHTR